MIIINCKNCNKEVKTYPSRIGRKKFCSPHCRGKFNPTQFKNGHSWVGKIKVDKQRHTNGYLFILSIDHPHKSVRNTVAEHRLVVEDAIGRYLKPEEVIHHIDGNKANNHITNLLLLPNQSEHAKLHYKTRKLDKKGKLL